MSNLTQHSNNDKANKEYSGILKAAIIIFVLLVLWHFLGPLIGITVVLGAGAFAFLLGLLMLIALGCLMAPVLACAGTLIIAVLVLVLAMVGLVLFPILWPFIIPIFIILLLVRLVAGK